jgi:hypothetical protein
MKHMVSGTMAVLYINSMKEALKAFHKNVLTEDYNNTPIIRSSTQRCFMRQWLGGLRENNVKTGPIYPPKKK